jgi:hypothetical protein
MFGNIMRIFLLILLCKQLNAQTDFNTELLKLEHKIYGADSDSSRNQFKYQKVLFFLRNDSINQSLLNEFDRLDYFFLDSTSQADYFWNASLVYYAKGLIYESLHYNKKYITLTNDSSKVYALFEILLYAKYNFSIAEELIQKQAQLDSSFACLNCLVHLSEVKYPMKRTIKVVSFIIPGGGLLLNGNILKGSTSVVLNFASAFVLYSFFKNSYYVHVIGIGSNLFSKFYFGSIRLTDRMIANKTVKKQKSRANQCAASIDFLLNQYQFEFRF